MLYELSLNLLKIHKQPIGSFFTNFDISGYIVSSQYTTVAFDKSWSVNDLL
jgi:hypothetical protein